MSDMSNSSNHQAIENTRRAIVRRTLDTLDTLAHENTLDIEEEVHDLQTVDMARSPDIAITFNLSAADHDLTEHSDFYRHVNEPTSLTMVLRDSYRAEAHFHNPETGELEPFALTPEEQQRLDHYAALTGRYNVRVHEILRTNNDTIGSLSSVDTTTVEMLLFGNLKHAQELAAELRKRDEHIQPLQKNALRRCLETALELFPQSLEPPPTAE